MRRTALFLAGFAALAAASFAQDASKPAGLTEGVDPAIARRMAAMGPQPPAPYSTPVPTHGDWPTWGYDPERTGWNRGETTISPRNVGKLKQVWSMQLPVP